MFRTLGPYCRVLRGIGFRWRPESEVQKKDWTFLTFSKKKKTLLEYLAGGLHDFGGPGFCEVAPFQAFGGLSSQEPMGDLYSAELPWLGEGTT